MILYRGMFRINNSFLRIRPYREERGEERGGEGGEGASLFSHQLTLGHAEVTWWPLLDKMAHVAASSYQLL
jgi:hypothetical protein